MLELARMKETMDRMEQERAEMVAEVEAQIERALASMAVDIDESDYGSSRPSSRLSSASAPSRSRRTSDAAKTHHLRSFGTESTLAEAYEEGDQASTQGHKSEITTETIAEADEEDLPSTPSRKKRFSASGVDVPQDGMNAVDEGISQKSEKIAQKVLQIEQKVSPHVISQRSYSHSDDPVGSLKLLLLPIADGIGGRITRPEKVKRTLRKLHPSVLVLRKAHALQSRPIRRVENEAELHHQPKLARVFILMKELRRRLLTLELF